MPDETPTHSKPDHRFRCPDSSFPSTPAHSGDEHHANEFELPSGGSGAMTFTLPPSKAGTYTFTCFETTGNKKHYEMGMKGTLTVEASTGN